MVVNQTLHHSVQEQCTVKYTARRKQHVYSVIPVVIYENLAGLLPQWAGRQEGITDLAKTPWILKLSLQPDHSSYHSNQTTGEAYLHIPVLSSK